MFPRKKYKIRPFIFIYIVGAMDARWLFMFFAQTIKAHSNKEKNKYKLAETSNYELEFAKSKYLLLNVLLCFF